MFQSEPTRVAAPSVAAVPDPSPAPRPELVSHEGRYTRVEPLDPGNHADALFAASHGDQQRERIWDYLPYGPFGSEGEFRAHLNAQAASEDPLFFAIRPRASDQAAGVASLMTIEPDHRSIEIEIGRASCRERV